ncbi:MAG: DUF4276 family protein [Actinobacteria bacterium]|nr:DUF4276 family protein [Actinomycetota bacterium]MCL5445979.1 DUF4276 family protein [Actinomycetota bacterium]
MHLEVLVEEASAEKALSVLLPKIVGPDVDFTIHVFQGKRDLLDKLASRLKGYSHWIQGTHTKIAVLVDEDRQNCLALKEKLEKAAAEAGLSTKTAVGNGNPFLVLNRIAVEELEAWFIGDCDALRAAYPRISPSLENTSRFRDPDAVRGGTWEQLDRVLQQAGYHAGGMAKTRAAEEIAVHMDPYCNRSRSFKQFCTGLQALVQSI